MNKVEHLLSCLGEECAEVIKETSKANRFSLSDQYVDRPTPKDKIIQELNDVFAIASMLTDEGILPKDILNLDMIKAKKEKVKRYMQYAYEKGTLTD